MKKSSFGILPSGESVSLYTIESGDSSLTLTDFGAAVVAFQAFGRDIVGGFDSIDGYLTDDSHQGGTIGRVANRIGGARFTMDGVEYRLPDNNDGNCLHGGCGFDRRIWRVTEHSDDRICFAYTSYDGEEGFPSELEVSVAYTLTGSRMRIDYEAIPKGKTPIALTNHTYFNLDGLGGDVLEHRVRIYADRYTEVGSNMIPTGKRPSVEGSVFDLRESKRIGEGLIEGFGGYDHNFILCRDISSEFDKKHLYLAAEVWGRDLHMEVWTDQPGVQFYIGNFLGDGPDFKGGIKQVKRGALCLETQTEPNCINHGEGFYECGEVYRHTTVYDVKKYG